jgi:nucleotide-binding universal stress UspA family protein
MKSQPGDSKDSPERLSAIHHIGVCVDRSPIADRIIPHAVALAQIFGARLTILHALEPRDRRPGAAPTDPLEWEIQRAEARRHLSSIQSEHAGTDAEMKREIVEGHPAEELRDWISSHDVDLTVLCSHGASGWTEWSLASTARKLIEGIGGSVLLVPAWSVQEPLKHEISYDRILVPLDGSRRAESALPVATHVARAHGSKLVLLHVVPQPERACPCPRRTTDEALEEPDLEQRLVDRNKRAAESYLEDVRARVARSGLRAQTHVAVDCDVRGELQRHIADDHVDLVVLTGHGRGGHPELPFGSTASFLLEHATAPLLVVRDPSNREERDDSRRPRSRSRMGVRLPPLAKP